MSDTQTQTADVESVAPRAPKASTARTVTGVVTSNKMDKSITVLIERRVHHPIYGKIIRRSTKLHAHDEKNECGIGDVVTIRECRPISKTKSWVLTGIVERATSR